MGFHSHTASETANNLHTRKIATGNPRLYVGGIVRLEMILKSREHKNRECPSSPTKVYLVLNPCFYIFEEDEILHICIHHF